MIKKKKNPTINDLYQLLIKINKKADSIISSLARINKKLEFTDDHDHEHEHVHEDKMEYKA